MHLEMVVLVNNRFLGPAPASPEELYSQFPHLLRGAEELAGTKPKRCSHRPVPEVPLDSTGRATRGATR